ncbi:conserved Plasmodium protein, unknown function [Plasmodium vivax]|uniref:Uncharacterized protein n=6 Tax=Plasmodium vivax TaxID=5855 RepID=A5JZ90_PLAVS|nr:hypothetical protein, conserved [Plasmodium vivax]KMZ77849.1 hypothetical protein PVIIG_00536 [Plasmodium vivax India VII]KMZ84906.1 hypothetical protein PVBG_04322 [Plasmodium vivax Brazil I]KMZ90460.1 hypothetical protein PVMG_03309 [Plasmodium vivax Mauritania I]KMZ97076.1 hypothetical protein PVNG_00104 [Plasmodium vivax North Korean]EDL47301.1 hypothetical protein, conserved [Plasmodium vivax]|eukprot:XP_001617028.1 hypothetical protein [Plasmodium vivax Sal-1]
MTLFNLLKSPLIAPHPSRPSLRLFTTIQLYKPSKFKRITRNLYFRKKLFKLLTTKPRSEEVTKGGNEVQRKADEEAVFYNDIVDYPTRKRRIYMNNKFGVDDKVKKKNGEKPSLEKVLFKCTTLGYIELQHIISTFVSHEKGTFTGEDICALDNFLNLPEKEIFNYLSGDELMPQHHLDASVIKRLLRFVHVNHPHL